MTSSAVKGMSDGLTKEQRNAAIDWINSEPRRVQGLKEQFASIAPRKYRQPGWTNDKSNEETGIAELPFGDINTPTLVAHGANDAIIPLQHATNAAARIDKAELIVVDEGHHLLSYSRNYGPVAQRQLELARR